MSFVALAAVLVALPVVRDPFWPVGYEGTRYPISADLRYAPAESTKNSVQTNAVALEASAELTEEEKAEQARLAEAMAARWSAAVKKLRFGGGIVNKADENGSAGVAVLVNGMSRVENDLVHVDYDGYRFIWRIVRSDSERKLRLSRVKAVSLDNIKGSNKQ